MSAIPVPPRAPAGPRPPSPGAEGTLRDIQSVTDAELSRLSAQDFLATLLDRIKEILHADTAAVLLLDRSRSQLVATAASGLEEEVRQGVRIPVGRGFAGRIAAERRPVILGHVDHTNVLNPILLEKGIRSLIGVPLQADGDVIGVLHVGSLVTRRFTQEEADLLQMAADRAAAAVQALNSRSDAAAAAALTRSLVPSHLPAIDGLEVAARYVPGEGNVGGDWYDVFPLPSGELGAVIGDVAGAGLNAAVTMGRMRSALRAYALETTDPADVLGRLDRKMRHFEPDALATVLYAVFDQARTRVCISSAGHLPPIVAAPGHPAAEASVSPNLLIGIPGGDGRRRTTTLELPSGTVLCLYTDGLVERRGRPLDDGIELLCDSITAGPPDSVCISVMAALVGSSSPSDDTAMLVFRTRPTAG